jgi:spore germination protein GerM
MSGVTRILLALLLLLSGGLTGCSDIPATSSAPPALSTTADRQSGASGGSVTITPLPETMNVTVYSATKDAMQLVAQTHTVTKNDQPARTAIELLLSGDEGNKALTSVVPKGTKLQHFWIKDDIAYVDFNNKLLAIGGGSTSEILLAGAIVNTLTEFPNIHKVQILVNGKKIDTLSGHLDVGEPLSRSEKIIKK